MIVSVCVDELFAGDGSVWSALTVDVLDAMPGAPAKVSMVTVAVAPFDILLSRQVTVPPACEQLPWVDDTDK